VADRDAPALHDERNAPLAARQLEEAGHRSGVPLHVEILDPDTLRAEILTGGGSVRSTVLAVDENGLGHLRSFAPQYCAFAQGVQKIVVAALVGIPWILIAAALYAWSRRFLA
jgi:hypothetical protein